MVSLKREQLLGLCLLLVLSLTGCQAKATRLREADLPSWVVEELREMQSEAGAVLRVDPDSGDGYLQVSTGADNKLTQHLKLNEVGLDNVTRDNVLIVRLTQYEPSSDAPRSQRGNDEDWLLLLQLRKMDFGSIRVEVSGVFEDPVIYELDV